MYTSSLFIDFFLGVNLRIACQCSLRWEICTEHWKRLTVLNTFLLARICNALTHCLLCSNTHVEKLAKKTLVCDTVKKEGDAYLQNLQASGFHAFTLSYPDFINSHSHTHKHHSGCLSGGSLTSIVSVRCKGQEIPAVKSSWTTLVLLGWSWQPSTLGRPLIFFRSCQFWVGVLHVKLLLSSAFMRLSCFHETGCWPLETFCWIFGFFFIWNTHL